MSAAQHASDVPAPPAGFELLRPLGAGATSVVWAATCVALGDVVALKWVGAEGGDGADLAGEAARLGAVDDPHVLRCHDLVHAPDGRAVLVLELAAGGSLADRLVAGGPLDPGEVARVGAGVAAGLDALHRAGLVHRDVKPSNVLLGDGGRPLLADLSAARAVDDPAPDVTGTRAYLDPRVLAGAEPDHAADVWALGATLFEALTGRPLDGPTDPPWPASDQTPHDRLRAVLARCLHPSPAERATAASLAEELAGIAALALAEPVAPPHVPVPLLGAGGATAGDDDGTRTFGPRPPQPPAPPEATRSPSPLVAVGAAVLTVALLASPLSPLLRQAPAGAAPACPPLEQGRGVVAADLDGDGCPSAVHWDGRVLEVPADGGAPVRYAIGRPGDTLLFGDWDCDGTHTPALHRPRTGETIRFDRLPGPGHPLDGVVGTGPPGAAVQVVAGPDGCDQLRTG